MRKFKNVTKADNKVLSEKFSFLLKYNEDCTNADFSWAAVTIFDHWLYETASFNIIEGATEAQKREWDMIIKSFLSQLTAIEVPIKYKYVGRNVNQKLQFSNYIGDAQASEYFSEQFDEVYSPNIVFEKLGVEIWFEDNWTIHFKYLDQEQCLDMFKLVSELGLYILPAYCADHLNDYSNLSLFLTEKGVASTLQKKY
ncbi:hypothetical protein ACFSJY_05140 [Thalassotalea euphylliae]|uniref:hypothetical protein n=1 Tax=Thalassotalea euphylliae TaxID=1655234 RepID=UPI00363C5781